MISHEKEEHRSIAGAKRVAAVTPFSIFFRQNAGTLRLSYMHLQHAGRRRRTAEPRKREFAGVASHVQDQRHIRTLSQRTKQNASPTIKQGERHTPYAHLVLINTNGKEARAGFENCQHMDVATSKDESAIEMMLEKSVTVTNRL